MFRTETSTAQMVTFLCRSDNIGVLIHDSRTGATAVIDVPEAAPVRAALAQTGWTLTHILITHHHGDHIDGVEALREPGVIVVGAAADAHRLPKLDVSVIEGDTVQVGSLHFSVLEVPGHTRGHIAYVLDGAPKALFAADTLFRLGCGRLFEGSAEEMWSSLCKLRPLPDDTLLWCGHEYTASNARFARSISPDDAVVQEAEAEALALLAAGRLTIPSTLGDEKRANPYLRSDNAAFAAQLGLEGQSAVDVFAHIRRAKDHFK